MGEKQAAESGTGFLDLTQTRGRCRCRTQPGGDADGPG